MSKDPVRRPDSAGQVQAFLDQAARLPKAADSGSSTDRQGGGCLLFAMDATASREPSWEQARAIQAQMFAQTTALGGLQVQLCYYRGMAECRNSRWINQAEELARLMRAVSCEAGLTQIRRVLKHALDEAERGPVHALVLVADCMEEDPDRLAALAGELGLRHVPVFVFQEGFEPSAERTFRDIARLSGGAFSRFDADSPHQLRELLTAVAVYAAGGRSALQSQLESSSEAVRRLTRQLS